MRFIVFLLSYQVTLMILIFAVAPLIIVSAFLGGLQ